MMRKKTPKQTLESRGIFVRKEQTFDDIIEENQVLSDQSFYAEVWEERPKVCFETGRSLPAGPFLTYFHHILPKSKYPQYRHSKWNIVILHPDAHSQVETMLDKCPRVKAITEHLKLVYG